MAMQRSCLALVLVVLGVVQLGQGALPLPSYITPCSRHESNLNACAKKSALAAIPKFMNGDRKYRIPKLDPIVITQLKVNEGVLGLHLEVNNAKLYGLREAVLEDISLDFKTSQVNYIIYLPRAEVACEYNISGRILVLPITGVGPGNITLSNLRLNYTYNFEMVKKKDGLTYFLPTNSSLEFDTTRMYVKLENLFNGNKLLGDQMNTFMDENWRELKKDIGPIIAEAVSETMRSILYNIFNLVDYDQAFPDVPPLNNF